MKHNLTILLLLITVFTANGKEWIRLTCQEQFSALKKWETARTEEGMKKLIEITLDESLDIQTRANAGFSLKEGYVPPNEVYKWADKSLIEAPDIIVFIASSSELDRKRWLEHSQTVASEKNTKSHKIQIYLNEIAYYNGTPIAELNEKNQLDTLQRELGMHEIERIEYDRAPNGFLIAYGFYTDQEGNQRIIAMLDSKTFRTDQKIEPVERVNARAAPCVTPLYVG